MSTEIERARQLLQNLVSTSPNIEICTLISSQGLPMITIGSSQVDDRVIAVTTLTLFSVARKALNELKRGDIKKMLIEGENEYVILASINNQGFLVAITRSKNVNLGLILMSMSRAVEELTKILTAK
ncbi:MAG: roadblock/LC7 domain-containing protein [Candidatus Baldrarchaeia archaeon]